MIPPIDSDWETIAAYALTFNGYEYAESHYLTENSWKSLGMQNASPVEKLGVVWDNVCSFMESASVEELRAALFFLQRAGRFCGDEGTPSDLEEARAILQFLHEKIL